MVIVTLTVVASWLQDLSWFLHYLPNSPGTWPPSYKRNEWKERWIITSSTFCPTVSVQWPNSHLPTARPQHVTLDDCSPWLSGGHFWLAWHCGSSLHLQKYIRRTPWCGGRGERLAPCSPPPQEGKNTQKIKPVSVSREKTDGNIPAVCLLVNIGRGAYMFQALF